MDTECEALTLWVTTDLLYVGCLMNSVYSNCEAVILWVTTDLLYVVFEELRAL